LLGCLNSTNEYVASLAALALGHFNLNPELCVPALSNAAALSTSYRIRRNSIGALGGFGPAATPALNAVSNSLFDPDLHIRELATNAVRKIAPKVFRTNEASEFIDPQLWEHLNPNIEQ
jgi:HEAT repeat protein